MKSCLKPNFSKESYSGDIDFSTLQGENIDEILANVETMLEGTPFSTSLDSSLDVDTYQDSISSLIDTIIEKLDKKEGLPFELNRSAKGKIRSYFKGKLLPRPLTKTEQSIQAVIAGSDLITEDERRSLRLSRTLREVYGNNDAINSFRQSQFDEEMRVRTIIDVAGRRIIDTQDDLNEGIMKYQSELFKIIRDFLKTLGFDLSEVPQSLYRSKAGDDSVKVLQRNYTNALLMMYNYIKNKRNNGQLDQILEDGWESKIFGREGTLEYDAINAYVNLNYFDDILKECFGDYINIDYNYDLPIVIEQNNGSAQVSYKYSFAKGNVNAVKTWGVEVRDALEEMSKFQQILIKSIPIYNYETRSIETGRLQPKDFVGSISKLLDVGAQIVNDLEFSKAVNSFQDHPTRSLDTIFKRLFENRNNATLLSDLEKLGLDSNNINFLYSIYKTVFKGKDSWKTIENEYIKSRGLTQRYNLIDTLLGVMDSNVAMNYAQTTYDHDSGIVETSVKARYSANRTKFDIVNSVNSLTIDRANKSDILSQFKIRTTNKRDYTVTLNVNGTDEDFEIVCRDKKNLLDKDPKSTKIDVPAIDALLGKVDLTTIESRQRLASREGLNEDEQKFMSVLDFIDTMFENTFFGRDIDGLKEFHLVTKMNKSNFKEMFLSAARALLVTDIYNQFEQATKENGGKYSRTELLKFLDDNDVYADKIQSASDKNKKGYFIQRYDGYLLNTLRATQIWIEDLAKVRAILAGDTSKSVIANLDGDKIPNFGPGYLGARIEQQLTRSHNAAKATSHLLFVAQPTAIKAKVVNTDVITKDGVKKQIKNMTEGELLYDAIVNKFIAPFLKNQSVYTQPTTFSDKTKFILYQISLENLGINSLSSPSFNQMMELKMIDTIGAAYKEVYAQVLDDYARIFPKFVVNGKVDLDLVLKWLKTHKETDFTKKALQTGVTIYKDVHYRQIIGKTLSINELLYEYANNLYTPEALHRRLEFEKVNFVNDILSKRLGFEINYDSNGSLDRAGNEMTKMLIRLTNSGDEGKSWVRGSRMALARIRNIKTGRVKKVTQGHISLQSDEVFEINPVLNAFFMIDNLVGNNLRFSLTGSEINHKVKALAKLDLGARGANLYKDFLQTYSPSYDGGTVTFYDISKAIDNFGRSIGPDGTVSTEDERIINGLMKIYNDNIYKIENGALNAQFKRNVIIPGTMRYYLQGRLNGIRDKMKVAVINDLGADVFNFDGLSSGIDAHDGSAFVNPFSSILENNSLQDCEVGTVKKPIQHWYDDRYMSATLLKYAIDTITNQWMRQSEGNQTVTNTKHGIVLRNVFKKMTNVRWHNPDGSWKFGEINLIDGCEFRSNPKINFLEHIAEKNGDIKGLFYRDGLEHKKIHDFGVENGIYYTIEYSVDNTGTAPYDPKKIYHYFQNDGTHIKSETLLSNPNLHTIDSLFELHTALGGIYSESIDSNGNLQYSEASNYAVAQFINNVATLREGADPEELTLESYYQPLKQAMIDVLANNSAVKNGAGNMNPTSSFYDDTEFSYIEIGTNGYGIQMDADHTADEGHMTEFSQVISSLDAGGRLHGYVSQIYETLGKLAVDLSEVELNAIEEFRESGNLSDVYDVVGRTIMNNLSKNRGQAGLANAIIDAIKEKFNLNTDHALDEFKIPFSDPNIYSTILSTFVSVINKKSIKRLYPGLGTVMVPGYDISMIYEIDGNTYQYEDLLKIAIQSGYISSNTDLSQKNREIVQQYLQAKQNELPIYTSSEIFQPTDNVRISYNVEGTGETKIIEVSLNNIDDYYTFKNDIIAFLNGRGVLNPTNISYQKNILVPRNLAPVRIYWEYDDETGHHAMNIFDSWAIKGLYLYQKEIDEKVKTKQLSKKEGERLKEAKHKELTPLIQKTFDDLDKGIYYRSPEDTVGVRVYSFDEEGNRQERVSNKAAELIMSNLYKSKFGLNNGDSLSDVMSEGVAYFRKRLVESVVPVVSDNYDLVYTKLDNRNLYITFKPLHQNDENFDSTRREWRNKIKKEFTYPEGYSGPKTIINRVYAATNDNIALFEAGREILREDVQYDETKKKFVDKAGNVLQNLRSFIRWGKDKVLEYVEFISNNQVTEIGETTIKYDLYNINRDAIKKVLLRLEYTQELLTRTDKKTGETYTITLDLKFDEEVNNFISHLLADVYHTRDFNGMQVNNKVTVGSAYVLQHTLYGLGELLKYDNDLSEYIRGGVDSDGNRTQGLVDLINSGKAADGYVSYSNRVKTRILGQYRDKLALKQFTSFKKSQEFTVSRIPAQTLQSFMQMRNVGFTGTPTNQCFVSHWQTWLQGSDYDIDKAYIMGLSFDGNGKYVGWSNLFDYSSLSAIKASEYLPIPKRKIYKKTDDGFNIDSFVVRIAAANTAVDRINGYVELITYLNENNITDITYTVQEGAGVLANLRMHEFTKIPLSLTEESSKNFISSHIQNTVQNLRNMIGAYSPIDMEVFRSASEASPKGEQASKMTLLNPSTKLLMLYQNITGKNVIGIAANGEKASFMWHYYINDVLREVNPFFNSLDYQGLLNAEINQVNLSSEIKYDTINIRQYLSDSNYRKDVISEYSQILDQLPTLKKLDPYIKKLEYSLFNFTTSRLHGRASGSIETMTVNTLPDVNFEGINPSLIEKFGVQMTGDITVDLMISLILSAATDNAKELILAKVNAGNKLAKMYLFLVTLGFNINDIVKFMTSPVVSFIDAITEANIFTGQNTSIPDAIKIARGDFKSYYKSFMSKRTLAKIGNLDNGSEIKKKLDAGITEGIKNTFSEGSTEFIEFENALNAIDEARYILESSIENEVESVHRSNPGKSKEDIREEILNSIPQDIDEFENILEGANEFSNFGRILGFNQGLPTSKADLQKKVLFIQKILSDRETNAGVEGELLDVRRLFIDEAYRKEIKDRYEQVKKCINIFDIIDHIPQFNSIFKIFSAVMDIDHNISIKTRKFDGVYKELKEGSHKVGYMSEEYQTRLLKGIDDAIIAKFINNSNIKIPYKAGVNVLNDLRQIIPAREDGQIEFNSLSDVASFKYLFETYIIPLLKQGRYVDVLNGQNVEIEDKSLSTNKFIQSLIRGDHRGMPLYKCDLDMLTIENSLNSKIKFLNYLRGLQELQKIKINGMALSDMFVLYNLIVNKNQYGSDRMTTLFDQFILNTGSLSLIKEYLNYVGELDYTGSEDELQVSILDLMKNAAAIVNSEVGLKDPTIIVNTDNGPVLMIKSGGEYIRFSEIIPKVDGETQDEFLARIYNHNSYYVLGGVYSEVVDRQIQDLRTITNLTLDTLNLLLRQGVLTILKIC